MSDAKKQAIELMAPSAEVERSLFSQKKTAARALGTRFEGQVSKSSLRILHSAGSW